MKATALFLSFLLFSICTPSFFGSAAEEPDPVLDIEGKTLQAGVEYFILPAIFSFGSFTSSSFGNGTCPLSVGLARSELDRGHPVTFTPAKPKEGVVRVSTDLNIKFSPFPTFKLCIPSFVWNLDYDESTGKYSIVIYGVEGNPTCETLSNWFKIEKIGSFYKLVFCPTVCNNSKVICKDVGIFTQDGNTRLALTDDQPFLVVFQKA